MIKMIPISNFRIEPELKQKMRQAVQDGKAENMTDLIRKAVKKFLEECDS